MASVSTVPIRVASHMPDVPAFNPSRVRPEPIRMDTREVVEYARKRHKPTEVRIIVDPIDRPARAVSEIVPTKAVSAKIKIGSAMS